MEANPLGFIKDDPIFSRECVKTLHTRELWTRKAKVVRMGETAYKVVKARPKYDRVRYYFQLTYKSIKLVTTLNLC